MLIIPRKANRWAKIVDLAGGPEESCELLESIPQYGSKVHIWFVSPVWSGRLPVTQEIMGSNPIRTAVTVVYLIGDKYSKGYTNAKKTT